MSATVLLVATRDPRGMLNGRKMVLNTIISSFNGLGWDVVVAFFGKPATTGAAPGTDAEADWTSTIVTLSEAGLLQSAKAPSEYWASSFVPAAGE